MNSNTKYCQLHWEHWEDIKSSNKHLTSSRRAVEILPVELVHPQISSSPINKSFPIFSKNPLRYSQQIFWNLLNKSPQVLSTILFRSWKQISSSPLNKSFPILSTNPLRYSQQILWNLLNRQLHVFQPQRSIPDHGADFLQLCKAKFILRGPSPLI